MRRGLLWSHLLASILGGLVLAAVLLGFGVIGKQRTETVSLSAPQLPSQGGSPVNSNLQQIYDGVSPGVVEISASIRHLVDSPYIAGTEQPGETAFSSGFLISRQGFILTTYHGILGVDNQHPRVTVTFDASVSRQAEIVDERAADDIAVLRVNMKGVPSQIQALALGDSRSVEVGSTALALGNPFGRERTMASGIVSAKQPQLTGTNGAMVYEVLQTDNLVDPRADGGPLLNSAGAVIGVNSQIEVNGGGSRYAVGFATPIDTARQIIPKGVLP